MTTTTRLRPAGPRLSPHLAILQRRSGEVQLGWDPDTAVLLRPPPGAGSHELCAVLRMLDGRHTRPEIVWSAASLGFDAGEVARLLEELATAGILTEAGTGPPGPRSVRVHGGGPLADALVRGLRALGTIPRRSVPGKTSPGGPWREDLIVLTDDLVADPRLIADLVMAGTAHLQVRIRDGSGVVGPLVLPGHTSCLRCADLSRTGLDTEWPFLAAQLLGRIGSAGRPAVQATAAVALAELERLLRNDSGELPRTLNATVEVDLTRMALHLREWPPHPACGCRRVWDNRFTAAAAGTSQHNHITGAALPGPDWKP